MKIFYGVCGEGQGHAGRSLTLIEELSKNHDVHVFTFGDALDLYQKIGLSNIHEIDGLRFAIKNGSVSRIGTFRELCKFAKNLPANVKAIKSLAADVDLFITDFEPLIPRVARRLKVPCVSIDNQHKFVMRPEKKLPMALKFYSFFAGIFTRWLIPSVSRCIICVFHECYDDKKKFFHAPIMIRKDFLDIPPTSGEHVLVYIKPYMESKILPILKAIKEKKFVIYGLDRSGVEGNFSFCKTSSGDFGKSLASASHVICAAGNQLVGEAKFFGKPVLAIPIPNQREQEVNAWYVQNENCGMTCCLSAFSVDVVNSFFSVYFNIKRNYNGLDRVMDLLSPYLERGARWCVSDVKM